jgi:DNA-binding Lrp family transcriptional regulator
MFNIRKGTFSFEPKEVPPGSIMKPISVVLVGAAVLFDELPAIEAFIPARNSQLTLTSTPLNMDNIDLELIVQSIKDGHATLAELSHNLNVSGTKIKVSVAKLIKQGIVTEAKQQLPERQLQSKSDSVEIKPFKILVAFTDDGTLASCLSLLGINGDVTRKKWGFSDFCRLTLSSKTYNIFFLKGEIKLSFLWEPILKTTDGAIFMLKKGESEEHAAFFYRIAKNLDIPFLGVSFNEKFPGTGVKFVQSSGDMEDAILRLTQDRFIDNYL